MREQPGLVEHELGHLPHVVKRRLVAALIEPVTRCRPPVLRSVTEREQGFLAAHRGAEPRDVENLFGRHVGRLALDRQLARSVDEDAVVATIAAQCRDRQEHLLRIGDHPRAARTGQPLVTKAGGCVEQALQVGTGRAHQGLGLVHREPMAAEGALEGAVDRGLEIPCELPAIHCVRVPREHVECVAYAVIRTP